VRVTRIILSRKDLRGNFSGRRAWKEYAKGNGGARTAGNELTPGQTAGKSAGVKAQPTLNNQYEIHGDGNQGKTKQSRWRFPLRETLATALRFAARPRHRRDAATALRPLRSNVRVAMPPSRPAGRLSLAQDEVLGRPEKSTRVP